MQLTLWWLVKDGQNLSSVYRTVCTRSRWTNETNCKKDGCQEFSGKGCLDKKVEGKIKRVGLWSHCLGHCQLCKSYIRGVCGNKCGNIPGPLWFSEGSHISCYQDWSKSQDTMVFVQYSFALSLQFRAFACMLNIGMNTNMYCFCTTHYECKVVIIKQN